MSKVEEMKIEFVQQVVAQLPVRTFYLAHTEEVKKIAQPVRDIGGVDLPQVVAEIPWGRI